MPTRFKQIPQNPYETAAQIRQAMQGGNIEAALNLFFHTDEKASAVLFETFAEAQQQYENNRIGIEAWGQKQMQICQSILESECMLKTEILKSPPLEIRAEILHLLHKHKTEHALVMCEGFGDEYLLLQAQLYVAKNQSGKGLIESEYFEACKSKVNDALEALMGQITGPNLSGGLLDKFWSLFN